MIWRSPDAAVVVVGAETVDEEAVEVNVTSIPMKGILASRDTTKTHGTVHIVEAGIMGEGDTTRATIPQLKPTATRTEGTRPRPIAITRITNKADTEDHLSRRMIRDLHINRPPTEAAEEDIILGMIAHMEGRMGTPGGEGVHLPIEEEVHHTAAEAGMAIEELREGGIDTVAMVVDITILRRVATAIVGVVTVEVGVTTLVEVTNLAEAINLVGVIHLVEVISPADRTAPVSSLMGAGAGTTREAVVVVVGTNHENNRCAQDPAARVCFVHFLLVL